MKVYIAPRWRGADAADGGIRRVVEAQVKHLPTHGIEVVDNLAEADLVALHAGAWVDSDKPTVSHCHGLYWAEYKWDNWSHHVNRDVVDCMLKADHVTATAQWVAKSIQRNLWINPTVLYHGIDVEDWYAGTSENYVLWNKTRVDPVCDVTPAIELARRVPDVPFISTFGPSPDDALPNFEVTGPLPYEEAKRYIRNAGVYLATSRETFGIGTLEAMASGVPVLGWAWGGQAEIVRHRVDGWLSRPGDYESLAEGLQWLLSHRATVGAAARYRVLAEFTWPKAISRYADLYRSLLRGSRGPKVSVIVPSYNLGQYLPDTIASLDAQTLPKDQFEVLVVDDASTDGSGALADQLASTRDNMRVVHNRSNLYLAGALNEGITHARGKYVLPLDADNTIAPETLQVLSDALDSDRSLDIAYGSMEVRELDGSKYVSGWPQEFDFQLQMMHRNQLPSTSMYRRRVWERTGGYRRRCKTAEDADFWTRATSIGFRARKVTSAVTLQYLNRPDSMSHTNKDWDWTAWFPWARNPDVTPPGAVRGRNVQLRIPTYEPPVVSVVIPVGPGHAKYLMDAIDSVVGQTYDKWEVVVANDSGHPLGWVHPFVTVVETTLVGGEGPAAARNAAIAASKGSLILPLDADDFLQPDCLAAMVEVWTKYKGFVYSDWVIAETGKVQEAPEYDCQALTHLLPYPVTCLWPKSLWTQYKWDESLSAWEDWDFMLGAANLGYCGTRIPMPLFTYRLGSGGRRESMLANKDALLREMHAKWGDYLKGDKKVMACSGCGKGGGARVQAPRPQATSASVQSAPAPGPEMVLVEFTISSPPRTYRGPVTGAMYKFGSDPEHRVRYVHASDLPLFAARKEFAVVTAP